MKFSEFFSSAITGAREAGIAIEPDEPMAVATAELVTPPAAVEPDPALLAAQAEASELRARLTAMEAEQRTARYTAMARDWPGATADHLAVLSALDGTPAFEAYIRTMAAMTEQVRSADLFIERGSDRAEGVGSAWEQIQTKATALMAATPGLSYAEAITNVSKSDPALYARYEAEK